MNPVIFPPSSTKRIQLESVSMCERATIIDSQPRDDTIESKTENSQLDALNGPMAMDIDENPHQWESTMGFHRRCFDAEREMLEQPRKRRRGEDPSLRVSQRRKSMAMQSYAEPTPSRIRVVEIDCEDMSHDTRTYTAPRNDDAFLTFAPKTSEASLDSLLQYVYM